MAFPYNARNDVVGDKMDSRRMAMTCRKSRGGSGLPSEGMGPVLQTAVNYLASGKIDEALSWLKG